MLRKCWVPLPFLFAEDAQWEDKCTDSWGYSWCTPKTYPCPITCADNEQVRYELSMLYLLKFLGWCYAQHFIDLK